MKVLIISHNPVSPQSSMGKTFLSLFSKFEPNELCQLYIYPTLPNEQCCSSFFRMTDKEALKHLILRGKMGREVLPEEIFSEQGAYEYAADEAFYRNKKNKSPLRRLLRDFVWKFAPWYNSKLKNWIEREKPTCVFVAPGVAGFIYDFALNISKDFHLPIVTYICDEYYFVAPPKGMLESFRLKRLQNMIGELLNHTENLVVISPELEAGYAPHFGVKTQLLMTGSAFPVANMLRTEEEPLSVSYFGNLRSNRFLSLAQIGQALESLNQKHQTQFKLKIFSSEKDPEILNHLSASSAIELCGFVSGEAFTEALLNSHLLLHVESFDEESIDRVRNSISTKIADSLASGIPLVAYGPGAVSSIKHLQRNDCALVATQKEELESVLESAFFDAEKRKKVVENACETARKYHDSDKNSVLLKELLSAVSGEI